MANLVDLFGGCALPLAEPVASARRCLVVAQRSIRARCKASEEVHRAGI